MKKYTKIILITFIIILFMYQMFCFASKILNIKDLSVNELKTNSEKNYAMAERALSNDIQLTATPQTCNWKTSETVHIICNDEGNSKFKSYKYAITDSKELPSSWNENIINKEDNIIIGQDGIEYLHIIAEDTDGNLTEDKVLGPYRIDRTVPTAKYEITPSVWKNQDVLITVIATDKKSGVKQIKMPDNKVVEASVANYKVDKNGEYKFEITDYVGNKLDYTVTVTNIDKEAPEVIAFPSSCLWKQSEVVNISCNDNGESGFKSYRYTITDSELEPESWTNGVTDINEPITINKDGIQYLHIKMRDIAGNETDDKVFGPYQIDVVPPTATHTLDTDDWTNQDITITVRAEDTESGVKSIKLPEKDGEEKVIEGNEATFTVQENGEYNFLITDNVGNEYTYTVNINKIDRTNPTVKVTPEECSWTQKQNVHIECEDTGGAEFKYYQYVITDSEEEPEEWGYNYPEPTGDILLNETGIKYLHIKVTDRIDNTSDDMVFGPYYIDNIMPIGKIKIEDNNWTTTELILNWEFSDDNSGFKKVVLPDERELTENSGTYTVTENGTYDFKVYDEAGNCAVISKEVDKIDRTAPVIILKQEPEEWTGENIVISWECIETQSGFDEIVLPDEVVSIDSEGEFEVSELGTYKFTARDNLGNERTAEITISNIDKSAPELTVEADVSDWTNEDVEIRWKAEDNGSGISKVILPDGTETLETEGIYLAKENDDYVFVTYDNLGNSTKQNINVDKIDKESPKVIIEKNEIGTGKVKIKWSMEDNQSGIREMVLPTGDMVQEKEEEFEITSNGKYTFVAYDNLGNSTVEIVEINNL